MNNYTKILESLEKELNYYGISINHVEKTRKMLLDNIREETNNAGVNKKPAAVVASMFKKLSECDYNRFAVANKCARGYGFLDGYRLFISPDSFGYDVLEKGERDNAGRVGYDIDVMMKEAWYNTIELTEIKIDLQELKYFLKVNKPKKREKPIPYVIKTPDGYAGYNPQYLLDLLTFSGTDTIKYHYNKGLCYSMDLNAAILPVNMRRDDDNGGKREFNTADYVEWYNK